MKTMNLRPYHVEYKPDAEGFALEWWTNTEGGNEVKVRLKLNFWWIGYIAREMWKAIKHRQEEVDRVKKDMTAGAQ